jgi:hypothetical protein
MPVRREGNSLPAAAIAFPSNPTTVLKFRAIADTPNAKVTVRYTIRSPGVTFANGKTTETLANFPVAVNAPTTISKSVTFGGTPKLTIVIDAQVTDHSGGPGFSVPAWTVPVTITKLAAAKSARAKTRVNVARVADETEMHPAAAAAGLIRRLQKLLPALDELAAAQDDVRPKRVKKRPAKKK